MAHNGCSKAATRLCVRQRHPKLLVFLLDGSETQKSVDMNYEALIIMNKWKFVGHLP